MGSLNTSNAYAAFEKMEEKVLTMEAQAESTTLLVGGDGLESKFAQLESGTGKWLSPSHPCSYEYMLDGGGHFAWDFAKVFQQYLF